MYLLSYRTIFFFLFALLRIYSLSHFEELNVSWPCLDVFTISQNSLPLSFRAFPAPIILELVIGVMLLAGLVSLSGLRSSLMSHIMLPSNPPASVNMLWYIWLIPESAAVLMCPKKYCGLRRRWGWLSPLLQLIAFCFTFADTGDRNCCDIFSRYWSHRHLLLAFEDIMVTLLYIILFSCHSTFFFHRW